jgi:hypothetical protein
VIWRTGAGPGFDQPAVRKERVIANPNKKSAKKIKQQKEKRLSSEKLGKREKRQDRRDAKHSD